MPWTCPNCTFINEIQGIVTCNVCQFPIPEEVADQEYAIISDDDDIEDRVVPRAPARMASDISSSNPKEAQIVTIQTRGGIYTGDTRYNVPHGIGLLIIDGKTWEGEFEEGRFVTGTHTDCRGNTLRGNFDSDGQLSGDGLKVNKKGDSFNGTFANGMLNGYGVSKNSEGTVMHKGEWLAGKPVKVSLLLYLSN